MDSTLIVLVIGLAIYAAAVIIGFFPEIKKWFEDFKKWQW